MTVDVLSERASTPEAAGTGARLGSLAGAPDGARVTLRPVVRSSTSAHRMQAMRPRSGGGGIAWMVAQCGHAMRGADNAISFP